MVRSHLLFGAPVWAPKHLLDHAGAADHHLTSLEVFHRRCIRTLLALPLDIRTAILYISANKHPLYIHIAKAAWRYFRRVQELSITPNLPAIGVIPRWLHQLPCSSSFTISAGLQHYASATTEEDFYTLALTSLQTQLQQSNRLSLPAS